MGSFDCYCALCCGPLGRGIVVGSRIPKALRERKRRVGLLQRRLKGEKVHENSFAEVHRDGTCGVYIDGGWQYIKPGEHKIRDWERGAPLDTSSREDEEMVDAGDKEGGDVSEGSDRSVNDGFFYSHVREAEADDDMSGYDEQHSYDPEKVDPASVQWIKHCRVLQMNEDSDDEDSNDEDNSDEDEQSQYQDDDEDNGDNDQEDDGSGEEDEDNNDDRDDEDDQDEEVDKVERRTHASISDRGSYGDYFDFHLDDHGGPIPVYHSYNPEEMGKPGFPFHEACFEILARHLGYRSKDDIDKDVLYNVMEHNVEELARELSLDYGDMEGPDQTWECIQGYEHEVADPGPKPNVKEVIQGMLPVRLFNRPQASTLNLSGKVKLDPLNRVPYDVLYGITEHLSLQDTLSLVRSSWHVFESTQHPLFWKKMIRVHIVPFFYELEGMMDGFTSSDDFDWRGMFQWLDSITRWENVMGSPVASIANRRRIWNVCAQLAPLYFDKLNPEKYIEPSGEGASAILSASKSHHTPTTLYPEPPTGEQTSTISTQFIRSWDEFSYRACDLNTYWEGEHGSLRGVSISFGGVERLFGSKGKYKGPSLHINAGDHIRAIKLCMRPILTTYSDKNKQRSERSSDPNTLSSTHIHGMTIYLQSGIEKSIKVTYGHMERALMVLPGLNMIGLIGETNSNGEICKLGLLQAAQPGEEPAVEPNYSTTQLMLWKGDAIRMFCNLRTKNTIPENRRHIYHPFPACSDPLPKRDDTPYIPTELLPHESIVWKDGPKAYESLISISTFEYRGQILGVFSTTNSPYGGRHRDVGNCHYLLPGQVPEAWAQATTWNFEQDWKGELPSVENFKNKFEFDGPGGERIVEVHASPDRRGFRLGTNRGRVGLFGKGGEETEWEVFRPKEGEEIVGITVCFGDLQGWSGSAKMWSHFSMSDLGVITLKVEDS